ncbi:MAG TPA: EAL domain-containing protein [Thermoanaerobaculia bacterium]|nr:EAL domain-containing protein [Thermoanaerobaculia bacterium]
MKPTQRREPLRIVSREAPVEAPEIEKLRLESLLHDPVTGLTLHPFGDLKGERVANLGVIYVQLGRFAGVESLYGWELYDRILRVTAASLREDVPASPFAPGFLTMSFNGSDGVFVLFDLARRAPGKKGGTLESEAARLRLGVIRRLKQALGRSSVDLMHVHATALAVPDDPRVRPGRNVMRALAEASRLADARESGEKKSFVERLKAILSGRKLRAVFQPIVAVKTGQVLGYEALIRGPQDHELEMPDDLFAVAREGDLLLELESLCIETVFSSLPRVARGKRLFVNASSRLLTHSVFLDDRNLAEMKRAHGDVVLELSEKEVVFNYPAFREVVARLRAAGFGFAIDDAGSGYSGLESIVQLRPEYVKVAHTLVSGLQADRIKREIIGSLAALARRIDAELIAEGIEDPAELASLEDLGVPWGQGFLFGRPAARPVVLRPPAAKPARPRS